MIVYLVRDIPAYVMYCAYGESRSSLLIESTDSMILSMCHRQAVTWHFGINRQAGKDKHAQLTGYHVVSCCVAIRHWIAGKTSAWCKNRQLSSYYLPAQANRQQSYMSGSDKD